MMTVTILEIDMQRLQRDRFEYPQPRVQRKMEAVYLIGQKSLCCEERRPSGHSFTGELSEVS